MDGLLRFLLWFALSYVLQAYDLSHALGPRGALGIALDYSLATLWPTDVNAASTNVPRNWQFSTHLTFNGQVSQITDGQLWQIATDAFNEMVLDMTQYGIGNKNRPNAMAVSFTYDLIENTPVKDTLLLCQAVWKDYGEGDTKHRTGGKCAELMAAYLYYFSQVSPLKGQNARIATVVWDYKARQPLPKALCGDETAPATERPIEWGCNLFVVGENLRPVDTTIALAPYDLTTLAGGLALRDQI
ncbi:hypothetical protein QBC46DRAFT_434731 [Diplogelasinospora grovesii]|uniref:Uncharacterized protein n=1 Tax=Diplogelasinospora grovesii TaxID=303347 RepID=A0AAN6N760_9PEZI|nr:hypothetical protein QBC46DRAFT_434731 [Diplogelasinospora grovesii]